MVTLSTVIIVSAVIVTGLVFALTNGLHDASSVVATFISCGAATPGAAILLASVFGILGAVFGGSAVADTVSGIIDLPANSALLPVLLAAILGAVAWNLITWRLGLPSSSTHALVGGIIGAVMMSAGSSHVLWGFSALSGGGLTGIAKVVLSLIISPLIGFLCAFLLEKISRLLLRNARFSINKWLKRVQWVFAAGLSFSHGANDTQKITGLLTLALIAGGNTVLQAAPLWVRLAGGGVMFLGTLLGGWSIMKTIGRGIFDIQPIHSVGSQLSSVGSILAATFFGAPVSTTHVVVGSVMGVGAADAYRMVHWKTVKDILAAWLITIPLSAVVSAGFYLLLNWLFHVS